MKRKIKQKNRKNFSEKPLKNRWLFLAGIIILTTIIYIPTFDNQFVKWDDDWFIQENPYVQNLSISILPDLMTDFYKGQYSPVTTLFFGLIKNIGGAGPVSYHFFNFFLHIINVVLVFILVRKLSAIATFKRADIIALFSAGMFAIHPMMVEVIAWVSAMKVTIYSTFFLISLIYYVDYINHQKAGFYILSMIFFLISFGAKEQAVTLSVTLFAIDFFAGRKLLDKKVIVEKLPFLVLSVVLGLVTIASSRSGEFFTKDNANPFFEQVVYSSYALSLYISKLIAPFHLSAFYPYPNEGLSGFPMHLILFLIPVGLLIFVIVKSFRWHRIYLFTILFFFINIALVLQLMPLRDFIMADRYLYIPAISVFMLLGWHLSKALDGKNKFRVKLVLIVFVAVFSIISFQRVDVWKDSLSLFNDVVKKYPESSVGWNNRGLAMSNAGKKTQAIEDYTNALKYNPNSVFVYNNRGLVYSDLKQYEKSLKDFETAIKMRPEFMQAYFNRADIRSQIGDFDGALADYDEVLKLRPNYSEAYAKKGLLFARNGKFKEAVPFLDKSIELNPVSEGAYMNRGVVYLNIKENQKAISDFTSAIGIRPNFAMAYLNRGIAKISLNNNLSACNDFYKAKQLGYAQAQQYINQYCN